jgi:hypothetical protein
MTDALFAMARAAVLDAVSEPQIARRDEGVLVPMPTLPPCVMRIFSEPLRVNVKSVLPLLVRFQLFDPSLVVNASA